MVDLDEPPSDRVRPEEVLSALVRVGLVGLLAGLLVVDLVRASGGDAHELAPPILGGFLLLVGAGLLAWLLLPEERRAIEEPEAWHCKHCFQTYIPGAHFCPRCGAPQTFFAGTGRYESIYASAWILGRAAWRPTHWIHLVGLLGVMLPGVLGSGLFVATGFGLGGFDPGSPLQTAGVVLYAAAQAYIHVAFVVIGIVSWVRRSRRTFPVAGEPYGAPPWWTFDAEWALPETVQATDLTAADADT